MSHYGRRTTKGPRGLKPVAKPAEKSEPRTPIDWLKARLALALGREYDRGELSWDEFVLEMEALDGA